MDLRARSQTRERQCLSHGLHVKGQDKDQEARSEERHQSRVTNTRVRKTGGGMLSRRLGLE